MSQRSVEIRVGALVLGALGLLAAFVVVMGGLSFEPTYSVLVSFHNPGGLQAGAPVRISGVKVGRVSSLEFRGGMFDPTTKRPEPTIRAVAKIEKRYREAIRENSRWFVTSQGVLGEMFLAVEPGSYDRPMLDEGAVVQGISPPRLDLLLSESYELLHRAFQGIAGNEQKLSETFDGLHRTFQASGAFLERNQPKLESVIDNLDQISKEAHDDLALLRSRYIDGPQINNIFNNIDRTSSVLNEHTEPLLSDGRKFIADGRKLTQAFASDDQIERYRALTKELSSAATDARKLTSEAQALVDHVKQGKGSVGAIVMDEAVYDDLQELLRDLKHNPWKLFWRQ